VKGCVTWSTTPVRNYRDYKATDFGVAELSWLWGVNRNILTPPGLDELGLSAAMEDCIEGWRRRLPAVEIRMEVSGDLARLDESTSITLYRLVQEGLTNVARHACASRVHILMQQRMAGTVDQPEVVLTMRDDGRGSKTSAPHAGLGLVGMRERVEALAGRFDVTSAPGAGFGFTARLPVVQLTA